MPTLFCQEIIRTADSIIYGEYDDPRASENPNNQHQPVPLEEEQACPVPSAEDEMGDMPLLSVPDDEQHKNIV